MTDSTPSGSSPSGAAPHGARPAPGSAEKLDRGDLDFGLYRIMNLKTAEVAAFLDRDLLPQVKTKLNLTSAEERAGLEKELENVRQTVSEFGIDPDGGSVPRIEELNRRLAEMKKDADAEADVYNHLANFFARYYVLSVTPAARIDDGLRSASEWKRDGVYFLDEPGWLRQVIEHALGQAA